MMRLRLLNQNFYRQLLFLAIILLLVACSGIAELHRIRATTPERPIATPALILTEGLKWLPGTVWNLLPAFVALAVVPWVASHFIRFLYDTKDLREAHKFLQNNLFGMDSLRPLMVVRGGQIITAGGTLCDRVGGRGALIVYNDSAVVTEKGGRLCRVIGGPYFGFLEAFERVWEVVDLRPQRWVYTVEAMTRDGIPVACEADITFKIDDRYIDEAGHVRIKAPSDAEVELPDDVAIAAKLESTGIGKPLPYTEEAVFRAATGLWVRIKQPDHPEQIRKWTGRVVIGDVEGILRNIIAGYRLDWLIQSSSPGRKLPREEIRDQLRQRLEEAYPVGNPIGVRILDVDLGKIDLKDKKIYTQWIEAWNAEWERRKLEGEAEGEAELARLNAAQVQAQAEMVLTLVEAIRPLVATKQDVSPYLIAMQFVETLRWMAYDPFKRMFLPPEVMRTIRELERVVYRGEQPSEDAVAGFGRLLVETKR
ncbi:MAG: SPFH domain-containing protein [Anaerolineae bacterium]|nr:SPFH domain-containing protein [Anaerolineae bacterium]